MSANQPFNAIEEIRHRQNQQEKTLVEHAKSLEFLNEKILLQAEHENSLLLEIKDGFNRSLTNMKWTIATSIAIATLVLSAVVFYVSNHDAPSTTTISKQAKP